MSDIMSNSTTTRKTHVQIRSVSEIIGQDQKDAITLAAKFKKEVLEAKPHIKIMKDEIQMNKLKVRPFAGDLFQLNMANPQFISNLWGLLKLEEFVMHAENVLPADEADLFFKLMTQYREELQSDINKVDLRLPHLKTKGVNVPVTMEIFRDVAKRKKRRVH
ncbi:MAG: hypothetical protein U0525_04070 [Patescibacteria group bacterium]